MKYIRIKNWGEYQHYKDRSAPWIKLHKELLSSHFWVMGSDASKLLAICIMLLAQRNDNKIPADPEYIKRFGHLETIPDFQPLLDSELIEIIEENEMVQDASKTLASCPPEERERREENNGKPGAIAPTKSNPENQGENQNDEFDPVAFIFDTGIKILGEKNRGLIGKARKQVGDQRTTEILASMAAMKPPCSEPAAYFMAAITPKVRGLVV